MATDEFEPFRGLPLTREQDAEIRKSVAERLERGEALDTLGFSFMLKDMLDPPGTEDGTQRATPCRCQRFHNK